MHDVEVDQSGRTDKLAMDTVLAFSDRIRGSIFISKAVKRECYDHLKARGVRKGRIAVKLFIAGLVLLLQDHIAALETITIDQEYVGGHRAISKANWCNVCASAGLTFGATRLSYDQSVRSQGRTN